MHLGGLSKLNGHLLACTPVRQLGRGPARAPRRYQAGGKGEAWLPGMPRCGMAAESASSAGLFPISLSKSCTPSCRDHVPRNQQNFPRGGESGAQELYFPVKHKKRQPTVLDPRPTPMPAKPHGAGGTRTVFPAGTGCLKQAAWPRRRVARGRTGQAGGFVVRAALLGCATSRVEHPEVQCSVQHVTG